MELLETIASTVLLIVVCILLIFIASMCLLYNFCQEEGRRTLTEGYKQRGR